MTRTAVIALAAAALAAAAFALLRDDAALREPASSTEARVTPTAPEPPEKASATGWTCRLDAGDRLALRLSMETRLRASPAALTGGASAAAAAEKRSSFGALLRWQVLEGGEVMTIAADMTEVRAVDDPDGDAASLAAALARPVLFRLDDRCRVRSVGVTAEAPAVTRLKWQVLLSMVEFALPDGGVRDTWTTIQPGVAGERHARYWQTRADGAPTLRRRVDRLVPPGGGGGATVRITASMAAAAPHASGRWFESVRFEEGAEWSMQSRPFGAVTVTGDLQAEAAGRGGVWSAAIDVGTFDFQDLAAPAPVAAGPARMTLRPPDGLTGWPPSRALAAFTDALTGPGKSYRDALSIAVPYLQAHPEWAATLVGQMVRGEVPIGVRSTLFLAMQMAGGEVVRRTLAEAMTNPALGVAHRLQAASALADAADADATTVAALQRMASADDETERDVRDGALLALGALGGREDTAEGVSAAARAIIADRLAAPDDDGDLTMAMRAAANSDDPLLADPLYEHLEDPRPAVAREAWDALARLGTLPAASDMLRAWDEAEDGSVRRAIGRAFDARAEPLGTAEVQQMASLLEGDAEPALRAVLIKALGRSAKAKDATATEALVRAFRDEDDHRLQVLIGRYLPAEQLR